MRQTHTVVGKKEERHGARLVRGYALCFNVIACFTGLCVYIEGLPLSLTLRGVVVVLKGLHTWSADP